MSSEGTQRAPNAGTKEVEQRDDHQGAEAKRE